MTGPAPQTPAVKADTIEPPEPEPEPAPPLAVAESQQPKPTASAVTAGSFTPPPPAWVPPDPDPLHLGTSEHQQTLSDLEQEVHSPHLEPPNAPEAAAALDDGLAAARDEVSRALNSAASTPEPIQALNAQPLGDQLHPANMVVTGDNEHDMLPGFSSDPNAHLNEATAPSLPSADTPDTAAPLVHDPTAPPPVPPPIPFQFRPPGQ